MAAGGTDRSPFLRQDEFIVVIGVFIETRRLGGTLPQPLSEAQQLPFLGVYLPKRLRSGALPSVLGLMQASVLHFGARRTESWCKPEFQMHQNRVNRVTTWVLHGTVIL